jgi:hypothetical protein
MPAELSRILHLRRQANVGANSLEYCGSKLMDPRFTLIFDSMVASSGPGTTITDQRKNCQLNIDLQYPSGFQYSVLSTDFRGYAYLPAAKDTGTQQATYYFSGCMLNFSGRNK